MNFDASASLELRIIIQVLANYIMFDELNNLMFSYILWIIVALIPIFIFSTAYVRIIKNLATPVRFRQIREIVNLMVKKKNQPQPDMGNNREIFAVCK